MRKEQATSEIKTSAAGDGGPEHLLTRRGALRRINKHLLLFGRFKGGKCSLSDYLDAIEYQTGL